MLVLSRKWKTVIQKQLIGRSESLPVLKTGVYVCTTCSEKLILCTMFYILLHNFKIVFLKRSIVCKPVSKSGWVLGPTCLLTWKFQPFILIHMSYWVLSWNMKGGLAKSSIFAIKVLSNIILKWCHCRGHMTDVL